MMDTAALLSRLSARDVRLRIEDGRLKLDAPAGALDDTLKTELKARKDELLTYLQKAAEKTREPSTIVPIKGDGKRRPIFAVSGHSGDIYYLLGASRHLHPDQPLIGIQPPGLDGGPHMTTLPDLARYEIGQIKRVQPQGPYLVCGHCAGGTLAFEIAQQLMAAGDKVAMLMLIGAPYPRQFNPVTLELLRMRRRFKRLTQGSLSEGITHVRTRITESLAPTQPAAPDANAESEAARLRVEAASVAAVRAYTPGRFSGILDIIVTADTYHRADLWRRHAAAVREHVIPDREIDDLLLGPDAGRIGVVMQRRLDAL